MDGSNFLYTEGATTVSGLTIGGTVEWENTNTVNESGGTVTIGDTIAADEAILFNTKKATYDILDNSGIGLGASAASDIKNAGVFEKTGETGESTIAPSVTNTGTIEVTAGTLDFGGGISGTGADIISGASTLEFDANVSAGQTVDFTVGRRRTRTAQAERRVRRLGSAVSTRPEPDRTTRSRSPSTGSSPALRRTPGARAPWGSNNAGSTISLTLLGDYNPGTFLPHTQANGSTLITYTGASGLDSLLRPVPGTATHAGEFGIPEASAERAWRLGRRRRWEGSVGHGPGPS